MNSTTSLHISRDLAVSRQTMVAAKHPWMSGIGGVGIAAGR